MFFLVTRLFAASDLINVIIPVWLFHLVYYMDRLVQQFFKHFNKHYEAALAIDFTKLDLVNQLEFLKNLYRVLLCCTTASAVVIKYNHSHISYWIPGRICTF